MTTIEAPESHLRENPYDIAKEQLRRVAREFGIPAVVGADGACATLQDGQVVEIDGTTGTITVIDDPSE